MQTPGGTRILGGGEVLGVAQSRFVLAQAQDFRARGSGFESETLSAPRPRKAGFCRRIASSRASPAPATKKAAGPALCAPGSTRAHAGNN